MRNVRVGCRDEGENAGFSGTQGQPAEFCQEKHGNICIARAMGVREEGRGKREKGKKVCARTKKTRGSLGALPRAVTKRSISYDKA